MRAALLVTIVFASIWISHSLPVDHSVSKEAESDEDSHLRPDTVKTTNTPEKNGLKNPESAPVRPSGNFPELLPLHHRRQFPPRIGANKSQKEKSTELKMALTMGDRDADEVLLQLLKNLEKSTRNDPLLYPAFHQNNLNPHYSAIRIKDNGGLSVVNQPQTGVRRDNRELVLVANPNVSLKQLQDVEITFRISKDFAERMSRFLGWLDKKVCDMESLFYKLVWFGILVFCAFVCVIVLLLIVLSFSRKGKGKLKLKRVESEKEVVTV